MYVLLNFRPRPNRAGNQFFRVITLFCGSGPPWYVGSLSLAERETMRAVRDDAKRIAAAKVTKLVQAERFRDFLA